MVAQVSRCFQRCEELGISKEQLKVTAVAIPLIVGVAAFIFGGMHFINIWGSPTGIGLMAGGLSAIAIDGLIAAYVFREQSSEEPSQSRRSSRSSTDESPSRARTLDLTGEYGSTSKGVTASHTPRRNLSGCRATVRQPEWLFNAPAPNSPFKRHVSAEGVDEASDEEVVEEVDEASGREEEPLQPAVPVPIENLFMSGNGLARVLTGAKKSGEPFKEELASVKITSASVLTTIGTYSTIFEEREGDQLTLLLELLADDVHTVPCGINIAHRTVIGGGVRRGGKGNEEELCRRTNLYVDLQRITYPLDSLDIIYHPKIRILREITSYEEITNPQQVAFVSVVTPEEDGMLMILSTLVTNNHRNIILRGKKGDYPMLEENEFRGQFRKVIFIPNTGQTNRSGKL